jgi:hypothetical protein
MSTDSINTQSIVTLVKITQELGRSIDALRARLDVLEARNFRDDDLSAALEGRDG